MKKIFSIVTLLFCFSGIIFSQENILTLKRYALVIGNQDYEDYPLKNTIADSELIKNSLEQKGFKVFYFKNLTSDRAKEVFEKYRTEVNKETNDTKNISVFYYAGHGHGVDGVNYLVPVDNGDIHENSRLKEKSVSLDDLANGIYCKSQIYIVDGGYDNAYKNINTRALGIKGSLASVRSKKESSIVYMFSSQPDIPVLETTGKNSVFAQALASQIDTSSKEVPEMFADVRNQVVTKTNNEQIPFISASGLTFAFGGEQFKRYQSMMQNMNFDTAKELSALSAESVAVYESGLQSIIEEKTKSGNEQKSKLEEEIRQQRLQQQEQDRLRREAEILAAKNRTDSENAEIERKKREFEELAAIQKKSIDKGVSPKEKIDAIEEIKIRIKSLRDEILVKIKEYNKDINEETDAKVAEIKNRPYDITETDSQGNPTKSALDRRNKKCDEIIKEGTTKKENREKELKSSIQKTDVAAMAQLKSMYSSLEAGVYETNSLTDDITIRILDFDGETGTWPLVITSTLLGYTTLFNYTIPLSYTEITGKKYIPLDKMNDRQYKNYTEQVQLYDSLFRESSDIFYLKLNYKIQKWISASEYRIVPVKCEIVRLDKKAKVIHREAKENFKAVPFVVYPQVEIRNYEEAKKDKEKCENILQKEKTSESKTKNSSVDREKPTRPEKAPREKVEQKGRGLLMVSGDMIFTPEDFTKTVTDNIDIAGLQLCFGTGKFSYWGINAAMFSPFNQDERAYEAGLDFGLNVKLGKHIRPFIKLTGDISSSQDLVGKVGGGIDFTFLKVLDLTVGYDYCGTYYFGHLFGMDSENVDKSKVYHKIYVGAGFAW